MLAIITEPATTVPKEQLRRLVTSTLDGSGGSAELDIRQAAAGRKAETLKYYDNLVEFLKRELRDRN